MYKTDPSVAIIACLSFIASAFALFFFFGFSESMAYYSQEMFEAEQCRYSIRFSEAITHSETETLISNLPVRTKNIIYESSLLDLDIRSSDNYETFKDGTPNMVWVEKGDKEDLTAGEVFTNYNQLDYSTQVSYIGEAIVIGEKRFTVAAVIRNYPVYNDIYFSLEDYRSLTDKTDVLGIVFNHPLTQIERGALDGLVAECAAEYSQSPTLTNKTANNITWSYFGQFAVMVAMSLLSVCAVYYYLIQRNVLTLAVHYCFGQTRLSIIGYLMAETVVVGLICLIVGMLCAILVFSIFTGYVLSSENLLISSIIYLCSLIIFSTVFVVKLVGDLNVSRLREELR